MIRTLKVFEECTFLFFLWCFFTRAVFAQDSISIPEILIIDKRISLSEIGHNVMTADSVSLRFFKNQQISDWLGNEGFMVMKNYGNGQLSTSGYRGTSSSQIAVLWNGIPIQSPFNASPDLAQFPFFSSTKLIKGANAGIWGSGAAAGSILISQEQPLSSFFNARIQAGSFGALSSSVNSAYSKNSFSIQTNIYRNQAENNFFYINTAKQGFPKEQLSNARFLKQGIQTSLFYQKKQHFFYLHTWFHDAFTEIPPVMTALQSLQNQKDRNFRAQIGWKTVFKTWNIGLTQSFTNDLLVYSDPLAKIHSRYLNHQFFTDVFVGKSWKNHFWSVHLLHNTILPKVTEDIMNLPKVWNREQVLTMWKTKILGIDMVTSLRMEHLQKNFSKPIVNFSLQKKLSKFLLFSSIGNTFRYPSLNDLYWKIGGNPNLSPEYGYVADLGTKRIHHFTNLYLELQSQLYWSSYHKQIVWLPVGGFWQAQNLSETQAYGIEISIQTNYRLPKHQFFFAVNGFVGRSYLTKERFPGDEAVFLQLIYQPYTRWNTKLSWQNPWFQISFLQLYQGKVFTTTDHSEMISQFVIFNLLISKYLQIFKQKINLFTRIDNLTNEPYKLVQNRPMPPRSFLFGIDWNFSKK